MNIDNEIGVIGGGISAIAFAYFYDENISIIEKEESLGGLCRSFIDDDEVSWDIGPHITFSKNTVILDFITSISPMNKLKRENKIFHEGPNPETHYKLKHTSKR